MSAGTVDLGDARTTALSMLGPRGWFLDHFTNSTTCKCHVDRPDRACDLGEALFRLAKSSRAGEKRGKQP